MTASHHLTDELLEDYVRGHLSKGWAVGVASHLALCPHCRKRSDSLEALAGALLDTIEPADVSAEAFLQLMERIDGEAPEKLVAPRSYAIQRDGDIPLFPEPLRQIVGRDVDELKWRRVNADVSQILLDVGDDATMCRLLRVKAGRPVAEHSHGGTELTLVLSGAFSDTIGTFARGDVEVTDETVEHQPVAGDDMDCICFAVTDAPLRFRNPIARLLQPFFRI